MRYCDASGWRLRNSCTDTEGAAICPLCGQRVHTEPDLATRSPVQVIQDHCA
jgi:hypothetical protein